MTAPAHNADSPTTVGVALIGDGERLRAVAEQLTQVPDVRVVGQAGMPQARKLPDHPWMDDPRVLIAEPAIRAVILAGSTRQDVAHAYLALERGIPVWRLPPLARTFAEAVELCRQVRQRDQVHRVLSWWSLVNGGAWQDLDWPADFAPDYSELTVSAPAPTLDDWRSNQNEAAGGVLAADAYPLLEALVAFRSLPENASASIAHLRNPAERAPRETEDTAVAILRYPDERTAIVRAAWDLPPQGAWLIHHGGEHAVTLMPHVLHLMRRDGTVIEEHPLERHGIVSDLRDFITQLRDDRAQPQDAALERHLAVSALLEAVYLAARTLHPESPRKYYDLHGWPAHR